MRKTAGTIWFFALLATVCVGVQDSRAGGDDPLMRHPDVFVIYDISGSMNGQAMWDAAGNPTRTRLTASIEVLTGTGSFPLYASGNCPSDQADDGIIDIYKSLIRFGMGAFDDDTCGRYGNMTWSYGPDTAWNQRRGLRGRNDSMGLVDVVDPANPGDLPAHNQDVQDAICGLTIHGCTPIAASLYDARQYFINYESELGNLGTPYTDPMGRYAGDCRQQFVLLMTDGQEYPRCNSCPADSSGDLCDEGHGGNYGSDCSWYGNEAIQAEHLCQDIDVPVFVVAFGYMGDAARMRMHRIARAGACLPRDLWEAPEDPNDAIPEAFFASNPAELRVAFTIILDTILAGSVSRTAASTAPSSTTFDSTYEYKATFELGLLGPTWKGFITRDKWEDTDDPKDGILEKTERLWFGPPQLSEAQAGDYFRPLPHWSERRLLTIVRDPRSKDFLDPYELPRYQGASPAEDGLYPFLQPLPVSDPDPSDGTPFDSIEHLMCLQDPENLGPAVLETTIKQYVAGRPYFPTDVSGIRFSLPYPWGPHLGDIFHSNPVVVEPPSALTPDFKYEAYFRENHDRHTMLYVGANDGFLHAFVAEDNNPDDSANDDGKELWAFMPFNLLSKIEKIRWGAHQFYVDGSPVVRDVYLPNVCTPNPLTDDPSDCLTNDDGTVIMGAYRTILIAGEREGGPAYFALDVTDPYNPGYLWEYRTNALIDDYSYLQCNPSKLQTWAEPIIGEVWLRKANTTEPEYLTKSVALVPGGYLPPVSFSTISSCVDVMEMILGGGSTSVVDMETGELLKRFGFSGGAGDTTDYEAMQQALDQFYEGLAAGETGHWNHWGQGVDFGTSDFDWSNTSPDGWNCAEQRHNWQEAPYVPPELLEDAWCDVVENTGDIVYQKSCCVNNQPRKCNNFPGNNLSPHSCSYLYREYTDGRIEIWLNTPSQCPSAWNVPEKNKFHLQLADASLTETMGATPAAYNANVGEFLTRIFGATNMGRIYRINLANGEYDENAPEGEKVRAYSTDSTKNWRLEPDGPWYDPFEAGEVLEGQPRRPITVSPSLAMDYARDLVVYFGTGQIDQLEYVPDQYDYFFAVKEERGNDSEGYYVPKNQKGTLLDDIPGSNSDGFKNDFAASERLFGQPLILNGVVYFTTFTPDNDECEEGTGKVYGLDFDDFSQHEMSTVTLTDPGPPSKVVMRWTPTGAPQAVIQQGGKIKELSLGQAIRPATQVVHWGKVL